MIGYFHEITFGRESLACDLVELIRPRLDGLAWELFRTRRLTADHFKRDDDACLLGKAGRQQFFRDYEPFARPIRRLLRRLTAKLANHLAAAGTARIDPTAEGSQ
jgi:CRISPR-associated protein Cas1